MKSGGSLPLRQLRDRGFTDEKIKQIGGTIQGRNVVFSSRIGGFDSLGEIIKLPPRPQRRTTEDYLRDEGPKIWAALHTWALTERDLSEANVTAWLKKNVYDCLPAKCKCECRSHWNLMMERTPAPFDTDNRQMADWTYDRQDEVNVKLGKPAIGREAARKIHESEIALLRHQSPTK